MIRSRPPAAGFLGIEAGGTRTTALWLSDAGDAPRSATFGPANLQLLADAELAALFRRIASTLPPPRALGIGMAGARTEADRARIRAAADRAWPGVTTAITHDLEIALAAAPPARRTPASEPAAPPLPQVLVLSGTGSCCYGRRPDGTTARVGGWGHLLGDQGSGYAIAHEALRRSVAHLELHDDWGLLGQRLLAALHLNEPNALVGWITAASKTEIAALAPVVFDAAAGRDPLARQILEDAARHLATGAVACAAKITGRRQPVQFVLAGSVLLRQPAFARRVAGFLRRENPGARITPLLRSGAEGAVTLARRLVEAPVPIPPPPAPAPTRVAAASPSLPNPAIPASDRLSPTEERNPRSMDLDRLSPVQAIELMISEDERLAPALRDVAPSLERALRLVVAAFRRGGRLFYVGAGTSGRLGILDASECPPTFRTPPDLVQGIIAGGQPAVFRAVEGAEDDFEGGRRAVAFRGISKRDVVVGIAASGRTPFVWGALDAAKSLGAPTVLLCFNPHLRFARGHRPTVILAPRIGPELLTGSTRLKSGTATKMILNLLTTLAMVRLGKVVGNLMVDLNPANAKLRERALRIVRELTDAPPETARAALEASDWVVKTAVLRLRRRSRG